MAIVFSEVLKPEVQSRTVRTGSSVFTIEAGKSLKIETSPSGVELFDEEVPAGKQWEVVIHIEITETDA